jgi:RNA polymerase sigma-70 factor (ECF subfamily)
MPARAALGPTSENEEREIARLLDGGDLRGAATIVIRDYGPQILGYLVAVVKDRDDADEAFGRFCEEMWKGLGGFRRECAALTWAYRVAWSCALRIGRDGYKRLGRRLQTGELSTLVAQARSSIAPHLKESSKDWLRRTRETLSPEEQTLLILRVDRTMKWRDIAQVMAAGAQTSGDSPDEVALRKRFDRLKRKLEAAARAEGLLE